MNGPSIVMVSVAIPPSTLEIKLEERGGEYSGLTPSCAEFRFTNATPTSLVPAFAGKRTCKASSADRPYGDVGLASTLPSIDALGILRPDTLATNLEQLHANPVQPDVNLFALVDAANLAGCSSSFAG